MKLALPPPASACPQPKKFSEYVDFISLNNIMVVSLDNATLVHICR